MMSKFNQISMTYLDKGVTKLVKYFGRVYSCVSQNVFGVSRLIIAIQMA